MIDLSKYHNVMVTTYDKRFPREKKVDDLGLRHNLYDSDLILVHICDDIYNIYKDRYGMGENEKIKITEQFLAKTLLLGNGVEIHGKFRFQK